MSTRQPDKDVERVLSMPYDDLRSYIGNRLGPHHDPMRLGFIPLDPPLNRDEQDDDRILFLRAVVRTAYNEKKEGVETHSEFLPNAQRAVISLLEEHGPEIADRLDSIYFEDLLHFAGLVEAEGYAQTALRLAQSARFKGIPSYHPTVDLHTNLLQYLYGQVEGAGGVKEFFEALLEEEPAYFGISLNALSKINPDIVVKYTPRLLEYSESHVDVTGLVFLIFNHIPESQREDLIGRMKDTVNNDPDKMKRLEDILQYAP